MGKVSLINTLEVASKLDSAASREYQALSGCVDESIPVEQGTQAEFNGPGSVCVHWAENCLYDEVMSPSAHFWHRAGRVPLSRITVAGFEDLGYGVDYSSADRLSHDKLGSQCRCISSKLRHRLDVASPSDEPSAGQHIITKRHEDALKHAESILRQHQKQHIVRPTRDDGELNQSTETTGLLVDAGAEVVYVLYMEEDGSILDLVLTKNDL